MVIDAALIDVFCDEFGEKYRDKVHAKTGMDDIEEWDSYSFIDLVSALEERFAISFTPEEMVELNVIGNIQKVLHARQRP